MTDGLFPKEFLETLKAVQGKRPRAVIDYILKHGAVTSEELQDMGYDHAPRAVRDVRELGIPIVTDRVTGRSGRSIASYKFGKPSDLVAGLTGRTPISKKFKDKLLKKAGPECAVCRHTYEARYLQVDHRVPVEVGGDEPDNDRDVADYMLLDGGCNRAKSWSCEHCPNVKAKDPSVCQSCYWANPASYDHVATNQERRLDLVWQGEDELTDFDALRKAAEQSVGCEHVPGKPTILHCRWMDTQRMRRRMWFWTLDEQGEHFPVHLPGECMVVRAAVADCLDERDEATWDHLMEMVQWLAGYDDERLALHAMLNALDAGAITVAMWHGEKPVSIVTDWHQGLES